MTWNKFMPLGAVCHLVMLWACSATGKHAPARADDGFARIAILNFANRTGSADFDYLSESLGEATREAMRGKFEFQEIAARGAGLNGKSEAELLDEIGQTGADVLLLGSYERSTLPVAGSGKSGKAARAEGIIVTGKIYAVRQKKVIAEYSHSTRVDARIFTAIAVIAGEAVSSIQLYLKRVNADDLQVNEASGKQALTLRRLKLRIFVPPMF